MRFRKELMVIATIVIMLIVGAKLGLCAPIIQCSDIKNINFGSDVTVTSVKLIAATATLPEHCRVEGVRTPEDGFIFKLPSVWSGRYLQSGNGGAAGSYYEAQMDPALQRGLAVGSGTGGHINPNVIDFTWGYPPSDAVKAQKIVDYCYNSVHATLLLGKKIVKAYYGNDSVYYYYNGCSTGGRQGMIEAQRYPEDFDGLIIGAPVLPFSRVTCLGATGSQAQLGSGYISMAKLPLLADAVYKKCDSIDGLVDGLIDDPRKCTFNPLADLPMCTGDVDAANCFTIAQTVAIKKIYDGPGSGGLPYPQYTQGLTLGSEVVYGGASGWAGMIVPATPGGFTAGLALGSGFVQWIGLPASGGGGPTWDWKTFSWPSDFTKVVNSWSATCDAINPNVWPAKLWGSKIISYHGWADPLVPVLQTTVYYEQVLGLMGEAETKEFYKFYTIPGMFHCGGGPGTDIVDYLTPMIDWVENGIDPGVLIGAHLDTKGKVVRTRPVCPYPEVARYLGTGDINDAENFTCVETIPAQVSMTPEKLSLGYPRGFTAVITIPEGYDVRKWGTSAVVCEGAPAVKVISRLARDGSIYTARFRMEDLKNITVGDAVTFTVTAIFEQNGKQVAFEGSDTIKIVQ